MFCALFIEEAVFRIPEWPAFLLHPRTDNSFFDIYIDDIVGQNILGLAISSFIHKPDVADFIFFIMFCCAIFIEAACFRIN